ncbi:hypothetical protein F2Q69_00059174 [Brassica cretica]|uniref:Uncharacterized protein n=1 Tax=Brassica cretica TaxID=69181 RepID=A0A8S9RJ03_BRACR|nr:hypothetical protein F2Q69_00059174 [Brassica cretica]
MCTAVGGCSSSPSTFTFYVCFAHFPHVFFPLRHACSSEPSGIFAEWFDLELLSKCGEEGVVSLCSTTDLPSFGVWRCFLPSAPRFWVHVAANL